MRIRLSETTAMLADHARITARIESRAGAFDLWFDVPAENADAALRSGNPWIVALLPYAMHGGEPIELDLPVDPILFENLSALVEVWREWYPDLHRVVLHAPAERASPSRGRVAQFFSGGADSWFTLLRHSESVEGWPQVGQVDDLLTVWGFDIPIGAPAEFGTLEASIREVAERIGKRHRIVATDLRAPRHPLWSRTWGPGWGPRSHGAALAAVALMMEGDYRQVLVPGSLTVGGLLHWGSHPLTDPMFSTSSLSFAHDHVAFGRADKIERVAMSDFALARLKVCYATGGAGNCSRCPKCHRTMMCLDAAGALDRAVGFEAGEYLRNRHRPLLALTESDRDLVEDILAFARRTDRRDLEAILQASLARSARIAAIVPPLRRASWRLGEFAFRRLAADMLG